MENSVLSDAAGVQKNISKMYQEYAQNIGKTTDSLTQAEKAQAVYNGIMDEASMFTGAAAEMAQGYQGQQAQLNATNLELSRTIGEAMIPMLTQYSSLQLSITKSLTEFISNHKSATSGIITFTTTLLAMVVALTTAKKAYTAYTLAAKTADMTTKAFTLSLIKNPITVIAAVIASAIAAFSIYNTKMQESIDKTAELTEKSKELTDTLQNFQNNGMTYTSSEKSFVEQTAQETDEIIKEYLKRESQIGNIKQRIEEIQNKKGFATSNEITELLKLEDELKSLEKEMKSFEKEHLSAGQSIDDYRKKLETLNRTLELSDTKQQYLTKTNIKSQREQLTNIAQTKADIDGKKQLLDILKKGETATDDYTNAKNQLVKAYPELAKVNQNTIASTEATIEAEERAAQMEWTLAQVTITESIAELTAMQNNDALVQSIAIATQQKVEDVTASIVAATQSLAELSKMTLEDFKRKRYYYIHTQKG